MLQDHPWHKAGLSTITKKTDEVTWYYDDHKTNERITINETGRELMKKMIIHIPETGFHINRVLELLDIRNSNEHLLKEKPIYNTN